MPPKPAMIGNLVMFYPLVNSLNVIGLEAWTIESIPLIKYVAKTKKPMIISTGMANFDEIQEAAEAALASGCSELAILHCVSGYPAPAEDYNLKTMVDMKQRFGLVTGLSDHTIENTTSIVGVGLGASIIEKHVTFSKKLNGPDHKASLDIHQFSDFVNYIREAEILNNSKFLKHNEDELNVKKVSRKSIVSSNFIPKGKKISEIDICFKRPGYGISPLDLRKVIGKRTLKSIKLKARPNTCRVTSILITELSSQN